MKQLHIFEDQKYFRNASLREYLRDLKYAAARIFDGTVCIVTLGFVHTHYSGPIGRKNILAGIEERKKARKLVK